MVAMSLALGLVLLVAGLRLARWGLAATGRSRVEGWLAAARHPVGGLGAGLAGTFLLQSSSAFLVLLLALVDAGVVSLPAAVAMVLGANLGSTLVSQTLALFSAGGWQGAAGLVLLGGGALLLSDPARRAAGAVAAGTGSILLSLQVLGAALAPLGREAWFASLMESLARGPWGGVAVGAVATVLVLSTTVTVAVLQALVAAGHLSLGAALPVVLGADVGTTGDVLLASLACGASARALAAVHLAINAGAVLLFLPAVPWAAALLPAVSPYPAAQIAHAHTLFNLAACGIFLPMTGSLARLAAGLAHRLAGGPRPPR